MRELKGVLAFILTPFQKDGSINFDTLGKEVDWALEQGADGVLPLGSIGEFYALSHDERKKVMSYVIGRTKGKSLAVAGASALTTEESIQFSKHAVDCGYDATMIVPPFYYTCQEEEVYNHYSTIAKSADIQIMVYHNPHLSKFFMRPPFIARLAGIPNVRAFKETISELVHMQNAMALVGEKLAVFHVHKSFLWNLMLGGKGGTIAPFAVPTAVEIYKLFNRGQLEKAMHLQMRLGRVFPEGSEESVGSQARFKAASSMVTGLELGEPRLPYRTYQQEHPLILGPNETKAIIKKRLKSLHILPVKGTG